MREARRRGSYADILALPPNRVGELVAGEMHVSPRPSPRHANATSGLFGAIGGHHGPGGSGGASGGGVGGWRILVEPELHLGADVLVPDLAAWRWARMPELPDGAAIDLVPDWVAEVLSPSTAAWDRIRKMEVYRRQGVAWAWLVDPVLQTVEVYELSSGMWMSLGTHGGEDEPRLPPFDEAPLRLGRWWR